MHLCVLNYPWSNYLIHIHCVKLVRQTYKRSLVFIFYKFVWSLDNYVVIFFILNFLVNWILILNRVRYTSNKINFVHSWSKFSGISKKQWNQSGIRRMRTWVSRVVYARNPSKLSRRSAFTVKSLTCVMYAHYRGIYITTYFSNNVEDFFGCGNVCNIWTPVWCDGWQIYLKY